MRDYTTEKEIASLPLTTFLRKVVWGELAMTTDSLAIDY
jgi:hypothetical protein